MTERTTLRRPPAQPLLDVEAALLDEHGEIVAVNDSWNAFTLYNGGDPTTCGVGANYLEACDRAGSDATAMTVAELIRSAIHGRTIAATSIVIACHAPAEPRWFELIVSPRGDEVRRGATVVLMPTPTDTSLAAPASAAARFPDVQALHHVVARRLAALDRLVHAMGDAPTHDQVDEALRHVDATIVALQRTAHEIDARRP
jgi:hypothetical protein